MELPELDTLLDSIEYPTTTEEVIAAHGARVLTLQEGTETVAQVLGRCGSETYAHSDEVRLTLYSSLCRDAVGRPEYSDRDPPTIWTERIDMVSF